jgi:hypothetical protein
VTKVSDKHTTFMYKATLKMEAVWSSEALVPICKTTRRYNSENKIDMCLKETSPGI